MKNKITVQICDKEYNLITEEPESYVKSLAAMITKMIEETAYKNVRTSKVDAAMICCLELCDKNQKLTVQNDNMRREIIGYIDEIGELNKKLAAAERQKKGAKPEEPDAAEEGPVAETEAKEPEEKTEESGVSSTIQKILGS